MISSKLSFSSSIYIISLTLLLAITSGLIFPANKTIIIVLISFFLGLATLVLLKPKFYIYLWILLAPFLSDVKINMGTNIPDINLDRLVFVFILISLLLITYKNKYIFANLMQGNLPLIIFLCFGLFSIIFLNKTDLTKQLYFWFDSYFLPICLFLFIPVIVSKLEDIINFYKFGMLALLILSLPTPYEYITGHNIFGVASQYIQGTLRVRSFTPNSWVLGLYLCMLIPFAFYLGKLAIKRENRFWRYFSIISVFFGSIGVILTFMRAAWLSLLASFVLLIGLGERKLIKLLISSILILFAAVIFLPKITSSAVWKERIAGDVTIKSRLVLAKTQMELFMKKPVLGNGIVTLPDKYTIHSDQTSFTSATIQIVSHNTFSTILVEFGLFGLFYIIPILIIIGRSFKFLFSHKFQSIDHNIIITLLASVISFVIQALTFETRFFTSSLILFWLSLGFLKHILDNKLSINPTNLTFD